MLDLNIGLSALQASQTAMDLIGQNIANAGTPGYNLETPTLTEQAPSEVNGISIGGGVDVATVQRLQNSLLDDAVAQNTSTTGSLNSQLSALQQVQSLIAPAQGETIPDLTQAFFDQVQQLTTQPNDVTQRTEVLASATALVRQLNAVSQGIASLSSGLTTQIGQTVSQINGLTSQIAGLNGQIAQQEALGQTPNSLLDQRDELIQQMAGLTNLQTVDQGHGVTNVLIGGMLVVAGNNATALQTSVGANGVSIETAATAPTPVTVAGGSLGGMLQVQSQVLPAYQESLNQFTQALVQQVNEVQATGVGLSGPQSFIAGTNGVSSVTVPLAQANLAFPPQTGSLYVTVTNQATGQSTMTQVNINPATESLQDVAASLSQVPNLQGLVNSQNGTLQVLAQPGYAVSFTSQTPATPASSSITGTTGPQIGGAYTGTADGSLTFTVVGSGTVGSASNLTLQVQDQSGNTLASLNIGQGYTAGTALQLGNGMTVQLAAGTANAGDTFTALTVAQPDTAGILSALGLNTFFSGNNAANVAVNPALLNDPTKLAASTTGQPGDASNLQSLAALANQSLSGLGNQTLSQFGTNLVGQVGTQVEQLTDAQTSQNALGQQLEAQQQSVSGVDSNEQLVQLLQFQRSYQMASEYISSINQALSSLMNVIPVL